MALNSVNTNVGAMIALQNLQVTNNELSTVQNRINTGKIVSSAKDNGAIFAIAQGQRAEIGALNAVKDSLNRGQSAVDVALSAGESVSDLLVQLKEKALAATDSSLTTSAPNPSGSCVAPSVSTTFARQSATMKACRSEGACSSSAT